ncbi:MAG: hypothetical protein OHK0039_35870 [Bacteroidia bacterium]
MYSSDLFGVEHPYGGEISYCAISGRDGAPRALSVYRGPSGLQAYEQQQGADSQTGPGLGNSLRGLMLSYKTRQELSPAAYDLIRSTGMTFRGGWPVYEHLSPDREPMLLEDEGDAQWMLLVVEQAMHVARRLRTDTDLLDRADERGQLLLVRRPLLLGGRLEWQDAWLPPAECLPEVPPLIANTLFLRSHLSTVPRSDRHWAAAHFFLPDPVQAADPVSASQPIRQLLVLFDMDEKRLLGYHRLHHASGMDRQLQEFFVRVVKDQGVLPRAIVSTQAETLQWWEPLAVMLDLRYYLAEEIPPLVRLRASLSQTLNE